MSVKEQGYRLGSEDRLIVEFVVESMRVRKKGFGGDEGRSMAKFLDEIEREWGIRVLVGRWGQKMDEEPLGEFILLEILGWNCVIRVNRELVWVGSVQYGSVS